MRRSVLLALVLVLALAGSSFAATLTWDGKFEATADYKSGYAASEDAPFFGPYTTSPALTLNFGIKEDKGVWDAEFALKGLVSGTAQLGKYTVNVNEEAFQVVAWGGYPSNQNVGHKGDALNLLRLDGRNTSKDAKFRVTTELGGFDLTGQVEKGLLGFNGSTDFDGFKVGATVAHHLNSNPDNAYTRFGVYGGSEFGIVGVDAAFAMSTEEEDENIAFGVKADADITDAINVGATFKSIGENYEGGGGDTLGLEGTYQEGLLRVKGEYDAYLTAETNEITVGAIYRGSEDNEPFADLFKGDKYYNNEAFAFGGSFTMNDAADKAATIIDLKATAPVVADQFWLLGNVTLSSNDDTFVTDIYGDADAIAKSKMAVSVDGYAKVGEKVTLKPSIAVNQWTDAVSGANAGNANNFDVSLGAEYQVAADAKLFAEFGQDARNGTDGFEGQTVNRYNSFGIEVKF